MAPRRPSARRRCASSSSRSSGAIRWRSARRSSSACFTVYLGTNWVPSMLAAPAVGFDVGTASYGLTAFNIGGVVGAILGAFVIVRLGSRLAMLTMAAGAAAGALVLSLMAIGPQAIVSDLRDAGVDRRADQRRADHHVRARGARLSDRDPWHGRRHGGRLRPHRRRPQPVARVVGARPRRSPAVLPPSSPARWWRRLRRSPPSGVTFRARRRFARRGPWSRRRSGTDVVRSSRRSRCWRGPAA